MSELRLVVDYDSDNECDRCGAKIAVGDLYYATVDDREIACERCVPSDQTAVNGKG